METNSTSNRHKSEYFEVTQKRKSHIHPVRMFARTHSVADYCKHSIHFSVVIAYNIPNIRLQIIFYIEIVHTGNERFALGIWAGPDTETGERDDFDMELYLTPEYPHTINTL